MQPNASHRQGGFMRLRLFLPAALCFALAAAAFAAPRPGGLGTVGGQVVDARGHVVPGARVTLQASEGQYAQTTETNTQGRFWFAQLPEGQYAVRAVYRDHVSEWRQNVWVSPGKQTTITLHLRPKK